MRHNAEIADAPNRLTPYLFIFVRQMPREVFGKSFVERAVHRLHRFGARLRILVERHYERPDLRLAGLLRQTHQRTSAFLHRGAGVL